MFYGAAGHFHYNMLIKRIVCYGADALVAQRRRKNENHGHKGPKTTLSGAS